MLYFAFGSNMNFHQMKERCPEHRFIKRVFLEDYTLVYDGYSDRWHGGVANIIPHEGSIIWGGMFDISKSDEINLNKHEGNGKSYSHAQVIVNDESGNRFETFTYRRDNRGKNVPSAEYLAVIVQGAQDCGLANEYIEKVIKRNAAK